MGSDEPKEVLDRDPNSAPTAATRGVLIAASVVLIALNLRPAITSIGPLLDRAQDSLGASVIWAGMLTTVPVLCFAPAGLVAPALARRHGIGPTISIALCSVAAGCVLRALDGPLVVLGGTLVAAAGIALASVLLPVVIKLTFPAAIGMMTGIYTAALQGGATLGFALSPTLDAGLGGWRSAWASWSIVAAIALAVWLAAARKLTPLTSATTGSGQTGAPLRSSPLAWIITIFFGLQAFVAFAVIGWLPQVLMDAGISRGTAGLMLGLLSALAVPVSLVVPSFAARRDGQSGWITGLGLCALVGVTGMMIKPSVAPLLWTILLGIGMSVFSLALTTITLRARTGPDAVNLSGMAQGVGYLLASTGPFLFGLLHDVTGHWTVPFAMLAGVLILQLIAGVLAGRPGYV